MLGSAGLQVPEPVGDAVSGVTKSSQLAESLVDLRDDVLYVVGSALTDVFLTAGRVTRLPHSDEKLNQF